MAHRKFIFISGLPRAGSTLLCNILAQNRAFAVSKATSGCHDVLFNIRNQWHDLVEHKAEGTTTERLRRVLRAVVDAYPDEQETNIVVDKGRGWLSLLEMVDFIGVDYKVIAPVRDVSEILASLEMLWRKTTGFIQAPKEREHYFAWQTIAGRCERNLAPDGLVGLALNRLRDAFNRGYHEKIMLVEMDDLASRPKESLAALYQFVGEPDFPHDFGNVDQVTREDDVGVHKIAGLHAIRSRVEPVEHRAHNVIGRSLANKYSQANFWRQK